MTVKEFADQIIPIMKKGQIAYIPLPSGQPAKRMAYQTVNHVAHHILRPGNYKLRSVPDGVNITRVA